MEGYEIVSSAVLLDVDMVAGRPAWLSVCWGQFRWVQGGSRQESERIVLLVVWRGVCLGVTGRCERGGRRSALGGGEVV